MVEIATLFMVILPLKEDRSGHDDISARLNLFNSTLLAFKKILQHIEF